MSPEAELFYGRANDLDLFAPEISGFTGVRVEPGNSQAGMFGQKIPREGRQDDLRSVDDAVARNAPGHPGNRYMNRERDDAQPRACKHHHRAWSARQHREIFRVSGKRETLLQELRFLDRGRDDGARVAAIAAPTAVSIAAMTALPF